MNKDMLLAASYERVSTDEQAQEGHSLEAQKELNIKYINNEGWNFYRSFVDPGVSGKNLKRPGIQSLLDEIKKGTVQIVVVHKLDRLTRSVGDLHYLINFFEEHNVKLVSVTEKLDTSSAMGRMFVYMLGIFAQWYRENLGEEVLKGMKKRAEKGLHNITVDLYGYRRDEGGNLIVVEEQAKWVRYIFDRYCSGIGTTNIAKELNAKGVRRNQGAKWDQHKVMMTLTNLHYTGHIHYKPRHLDKQIVSKSAVEHEPIISMEQYERAQRILQRRREGMISLNSYEYIFGGIIRCGKCGGGYKGKYNKRVERNGKDYLYRGYVCSNNERYGTCDASGISERNLTKLVFNQIDFLSPTLDHFEESIEEEKDERAEIEELLRQSDLKRARWQHAYGEGLMSYDDFADRMKEEMEYVQQLRERLAETKPVHVSTYSKEEAAQFLNDIKSNWEYFSQETKKEVIQQLFQRITIHKENGKWKIVDYLLA